MRRFCLPLILLVLASGIVLEGQARTMLFGIGPNADAFFDDALLHDIRLNIDPRDWQSLQERFLEDISYVSDFRWRNQLLRNIGVRSRGTGSRGAKPGLLVEFGRYSTDQRFLGLKSVILRNNTQDPSNLHERLSMLLFRRMGLPAPRVAATRLYVNGEYVGLYMMAESINEAYLARTYGEDAGYLYEYTFPDLAPPYYFEYRGADPRRYVPLPFKPETHESSPRPEFIERLVWTINQTNDAVFREAIAEYLDLAAFVRHVAVEAVVGDNDGMLGDYGMNNFYLYRFADTNRFTFIPWDKSEAFKNGVEYGIFRNLTDVPPALQNRLMTRVLAYSDLYDLYLETLLEGAQSIEDRTGSPDGRGWLEREIQREYEQIQEAALTDAFKPFANEEFDDAIIALLDFAARRGNFIRSEVARARAVANLQRRFRAPGLQGAPGRFFR